MKRFVVRSENKGITEVVDLISPQYFSLQIDINQIEPEDIQEIANEIANDEKYKEFKYEVKNYIAEAFKSPRKGTLRTLEIGVTSDCNLLCTHCYQDHPGKKEVNQLTVETIENFLQDAAEKGAYEVTFTGGECTMHPEFPKILEVARNIGYRVKICTNGVVNSKAVWNAVSNLKINEVVLSIDGFEETHDSIRGEGTWKKTIDRMKWLSEKNVSTCAHIVTTEQSKDDLKDYISFMKKNGAERVSIVSTAQGGAARSFDSFIKDSEKVREIYSHYSDSCEWESVCGSFKHIVTVGFDGEIYPCSMFRDFNMLSFGNISKNRFSEIYSKAQVGNEFSRLERSTMERCTDCSSWDDCHGKCRARAYKAFGNLTAPDPFACFVFLGENLDDPKKAMWGES